MFKKSIGLLLVINALLEKNLLRSSCSNLQHWYEHSSKKSSWPPICMLTIGEYSAKYYIVGGRGNMSGVQF